MIAIEAREFTALVSTKKCFANLPFEEFGDLQQNVNAILLYG